jgi:tetratricopeptide (TPR) repeat protein
MRIAATILLGPGTGKTVAEAIASVHEHVDVFVLIESGGGLDAVDAAIDAASSHGKEAVMRFYEWASDYGKARQFALESARGLGVDYALTLDPDERVTLEGSFRAMLEAHPTVDVWAVKDRDDGYFKERLVRCAAACHWYGTVCENVIGDGERKRLQGHFWEVPKTPEQLQARYARGVTAMRALIDQGEESYKWYRHMGTCLMGLGRRDEALSAYRRARELAETSEDQAWSSYLICEQLVLREEYEEAKAMAALGLANHGGFIPEFGWIIAFVDFKAGKLQNASRWAQLALNCPADGTRVSFRGKNYIQGCRNILFTIHSNAPNTATTERAA